MYDSISELASYRACPICKERLLEYVGLPDEYAICKICGREFREHLEGSCYKSEDELYSLEDFPIVRAEGKYFFLNPAYPTEVIVWGTSLSSEESAYHMLKCQKLEDLDKFIGVGASSSRSLIKSLEQRDNWESYKQSAMISAISAKYRNTVMNDRLKETGASPLLLTGPDTMGLEYGELLMTQRASGFENLSIGYEECYGQYGKSAIKSIEQKKCFNMSSIKPMDGLSEIINELRCSNIDYGLVAYESLDAIKACLEDEGMRLMYTMYLELDLHCYIREDEMLSLNPYVFCSEETKAYLTDRLQDCCVCTHNDTDLMLKLLASKCLKEGSMVICSKKEVKREGLREVFVIWDLLKYREPINFALFRMED